MSQTIAPYGTWLSPLGAATVAAAGLRLSAVAVDGDNIYWLEGRPTEGGRNALVMRSPDGRTEDVTPRDMNVRTRVHEYGGGAYAVADGVVYFANFQDQRVYRTGAGLQASGVAPEPVTPAGEFFYADFAIDRQRQQFICVREDHSRQGEPVNTLVRIPLTGEPSAGDIIAEGYDFYSTPRLSPDGSRLAWIAWRHPQMPWDGTELWVADVDAGGDARRTRATSPGAPPNRSINRAGRPTACCTSSAICDGWWKLYRARGDSIEAGGAQSARRRRSSAGRSGSSARRRGRSPIPTASSRPSRAAGAGISRRCTCIRGCSPRCPPALRHWSGSRRRRSTSCSWPARTSVPTRWCAST